MGFERFRGVPGNHDTGGVDAPLVVVVGGCLHAQTPPKKDVIHALVLKIMACLENGG